MGWSETEVPIDGDELKRTVSRFRVLSDWEIEKRFDKRMDGSPYTGDCAYSAEKRVAGIYPWHVGQKEPSDYLLHEVLHIAFVAARGSREREEMLVQDLCKMILVANKGEEK